MGQCNSCVTIDDEYENISVVHWEDDPRNTLSEEKIAEIKNVALSDDFVHQILDEKIYLSLEGFRNSVCKKLSAEKGVYEILAQSWFRRTLGQKAYVRGIACPEFANSCDFDAPISTNCRTYVCRNAATWFKLRQLISEESKMGRELYLCSRRMENRSRDMAEW